MRAFSVAELAGMRTVQESAMMDTCVLLTYTATMDNYGTEIDTPVESDPLACGYDPTSAGKREYRRADGTIAMLDGTLRLAIDDGETVTAKDRVRITKRHGETLPVPLMFGLDGLPERGPTGVVLRLVRVE